MGIIQKREGKSGVASYRVLIRRVGSPSISKSFKKKALAKAWMAATENAMDTDSFREDKTLFKTMIDRYVSEIGSDKTVWPDKKIRHRCSEGRDGAL